MKNVEKVMKKNQASQLPRDHISESLRARGLVFFCRWDEDTYLSTVITASNP